MKIPVLASEQGKPVGIWIRVSTEDQAHAKRPSRDKAMLAVEQSTHAKHLGGLGRLAQGKRRQDGRDPFGDHRFPRTGRSNAKLLVTSFS